MSKRYEPTKKYIYSIWGQSILPPTTTPYMFAVLVSDSPYVLIYNSQTMQQITPGPVFESTANPGTEIPIRCKFNNSGTRLVVSGKDGGGQYFGRPYRISDWSILTGTIAATQIGLSYQWSPDDTLLYEGWGYNPSGSIIRVYDTTGDGPTDFNVLYTTAKFTGNDSNGIRSMHLRSDLSKMYITCKVFGNNRLYIAEPYPTGTFGRIDYAITPLFAAENINSVTEDSAGSYFAVASATTRTKVYNSATYATVATSLVNRADIGVLFSPDGSLLAVWNTTTLNVYETATWTQVKEVTGLTFNYDYNNGFHDGHVRFAPDGGLLAISDSTSPYIRMYRTDTWDLFNLQPTVPGGMTPTVYGMDFNNVSI